MGGFMKEKELRLALVCYGGASLAIYMHGITKEALKLLRASAAYHAIPSISARATARYGETAPDRPDDLDSEEIYFDLFRMIGERMDLRVIVDIVAGASAGGINGVTLSRAIAHDLDLEPVTRAWLDEADVEFFMTDEVRARAWSKAILVPIINTFSRLKLDAYSADEELRRKVSMFLRSRWFQPPFDGPTISDMFFRSIDNMDGGHPPRGSLIPSGQQLHLFVTVTDFYGHQQALRLHDPAIVNEREHRLLLKYDYISGLSGIKSDFDRDHLPGLIFAARATSSYPGAFPPATIAELEALLTQKNRDWPGKTEFLRKNFAIYFQQGAHPEAAHFIDGGVLDNKPFSAAIGAIRHQVAYRNVDRRLIYIDPNPGEEAPHINREAPKFLNTLLGSLSSLPRNQPIRDDLAFVASYNDRVRRVKLMIESARDRINATVDAIAAEAADSGPEGVREARKRAHRSVMREVGLFYEGYLDLKIEATLDYAFELICVPLEISPDTRKAHELREKFKLWAHAREITRREQAGPAPEGSYPAWLRFLDQFDLGFRDRRIRFLIRNLNQLYPELESSFETVSATELNKVKRSLYEILDTLQPFHDGSFIGKELTGIIRGQGQALFSGTEEECFAALDDIIARLSSRMSLEHSCVAIEDLLSRNVGATANLAVRRELLLAYIGYAYWDVLTFTITNWRNIGEFDEIRIDRISPLDATGLREGGKHATLKGLAFEGFAGFFSRKIRENDYLWGRLHGAERMIDIVCSAIPKDFRIAKQAEIEGLKTRIFNAIIASERDKLSTIHDEFELLDAEIGKRNARHPV
ncbi:MAG: hypothetical protein CMN55_01175 [Sneathiella sp.]|jgi:patatin-related protein|nr:hypothetical protein [Sneathiella sp.]